VSIIFDKCRDFAQQLRTPVAGVLAVAVVFVALALSSMAQGASYAGPDTDQRNSSQVEQGHSARNRRFHQALARVRPLIERYGYAAVAVATLAEGVGIPAPGQTLLIASALEAAQGRMNFSLLLLVTTLSAIAGNSMGYAIGRLGGRLALKKLHVNPQRQQFLDDLFRRRGGIVVLFGRFVDGLRQLNGIVAGILKMPWWSFTVYNAVGAILWVGVWGLGTYYFDRRIHRVAGFFHHHRRWLIALSAAVLLALFYYLLRSNRKAKTR
jgi:membrane protein DedA with SNARE-associated domain